MILNLSDEHALLLYQTLRNEVDCMGDMIQDEEFPGEWWNSERLESLKKLVKYIEYQDRECKLSGFYNNQNT